MSDQQAVQYFPRNRLHPSGFLYALDGEQRVQLSSSGVSGATLYTVPANKLFLLGSIAISCRFGADDSAYGVSVITNTPITVWRFRIGGDDNENGWREHNFVPPLIMYPAWTIGVTEAGTTSRNDITFHGFEVDEDGV